MADLVERLEKLTAPSREVDAEIALAAGGYRKWIDNDGDHRGYEYDERPGHVVSFTHDSMIPAYTKSMDAAIKLVPAEWTAWEIRSRCAKAMFVAELSRENERGSEIFETGRSAIPAIAICIAALKARQPKEL